MGLFNKYLTDAYAFIEKDNLDGALRILQEHQLNHVNFSRGFYGIVQRMIDALTKYQEAINKAIICLRERKKAGAMQQITLAEEALSSIKADIKKLLDTERIKLE